MENTRYQVKNKTHHDIGVLLSTGNRVRFKAGGHQFLTLDEIMYIESICAHTKYFSKRMLVPIDAKGNELSIEELDCYINTDDNPYYDDAEIEARLKQSAQKIKAWLADIDDAAALDAIYRIAIKMDLPKSKITVLKEKMPDKDFLADEEE